ncbi:hypothetical protein OJAV_G00036570 [Oryzias javanicus]|uniref:MATH domain-containing protein n=1 Tax=Oryzias javanicus TaxID=123683 RepID=A0A437DG05_ORYJA|nr:hypothetical protein OJAV_G00036570 [Oryzias javanicus]
MTSGPNDPNLKWPCPWQQATMVLMDQQSDIRQQMNMHRMITTDPNKMSSDGTEFFWDDPSKVGSKVTTADGSFYYRGPGYGTSTFITHSRLKSRRFIKGDDAFFLFSLDDISHLLDSQPRARFFYGVNMAVPSLIFVGNARSLRRGRSQGSMDGVVVENTDGFTDERRSRVLPAPLSAP